jgi:hypothetical protein
MEEKGEDGKWGRNKRRRRRRRETVLPQPRKTISLEVTARFEGKHVAGRL